MRWIGWLKAGLCDLSESVGPGLALSTLSTFGRRACSFILLATQTVMVSSYAMVSPVDFVSNSKGAFGRTVWKIVFIVGEDPVAWWPCPCECEIHFQLVLDDVPIAFTRIEFRLDAGLAAPGYDDKC